MKLIKFLVVVFISTPALSQEYNFINEILTQRNDSVYLTENYIRDYGIEVNDFNEENFRLWWSEIQDDRTPSMELFFSNFNPKILRSGLLANEKDSIINFRDLSSKIKKISYEEIVRIRENRKNGNYSSLQDYYDNNFYNISKPIFNTKKDWVIIIMSMENPYIDIYINRQLYIYQKTNCKWKLFHKLHLWMN